MMANETTIRSCISVYRGAWRLRIMRLRWFFANVRRRIWWIDRYCDLLGHRWKQRGENWGAFDCERCHRKRLALRSTDTGKIDWIITL